MTCLLDDHGFHYADEAPLIIMMATTELGREGSRNLYACAECQTAMVAWAESQPEYAGHRLIHRTAI